MAAPNRALLDAANELTPFRQGDLDGLCGPYAVINALRLAFWSDRALQKHLCAELLANGLMGSFSRKALAKAIRDGIDNDELIRLAEVCSDLASKSGHQIIIDAMPERARASSKDAKIVSAIQEGWPVIVNVVDIAHFTVIVGFSSTRYRIFDSSGRHWLRRDPGRLSLVLTARLR